MTKALDEYLDLSVSIKSSHGTYLRAHPGGERSKVDLQTVVREWEEFVIQKLDDKMYSIKSCHGTYLRAHPGGQGSRVDLQTKVDAWEKFVFEPMGDGWWSIKSWHRTYLRAHPGGTGSKVDLQNQVKAWEKFHIDVVHEVDRVVDLKYDINSARTLSTGTIEAVGSQTCSNKSDVELTMTLNMQVQYNRKYSWIQKTGLKVDTKLGLKLDTRTGVPFIRDDGRVDVSTEVSREISSEFGSGKDVMEKVTFTANLPLRVPPLCSMSAQASFEESVIEVPWTANVLFVGSSVTRKISGVWKGSCIHNVTYITDLPVVLALKKRVTLQLNQKSTFAFIRTNVFRILF
ncbi:hypothetical protein R1sor_013995 [Riccia sorocarpa]|uniref:Uncharacterized protein n=1 Tax=Riccia sorocarpa TaxID=122646 RepID=A0ABD3HCA9_9MARC